MTQRRFVPCSYVWGKHGFGKTDVPVWWLPEGGTEDKLHESVVHHLYALTFWITYPAIWSSEGEFCKAAGVALDRFEAWQCGRVTSHRKDELLLLGIFGPERMPTAALIDAEVERALRMARAGAKVHSSLASMRRSVHRIGDDETDDRSWLTALPFQADKGPSVELLIREALWNAEAPGRRLHRPS